MLESGGVLCPTGKTGQHAGRRVDGQNRQRVNNDVITSKDTVSMFKDWFGCMGNGMIAPWTLLWPSYTLRVFLLACVFYTQLNWLLTEGRDVYLGAVKVSAWFIARLFANDFLHSSSIRNICIISKLSTQSILFESIFFY